MEGAPKVRAAEPRSPEFDRGAYFNNTNPGKFGITLNLNHPKGRDLLNRWCARRMPSARISVPARWIDGVSATKTCARSIEGHLPSDHRDGKSGTLQELRQLRPTAQAYSGLTFLSGLRNRIRPRDGATPISIIHRATSARSS